jgi:hypothetical protein
VNSSGAEVPIAMNVAPAMSDGKLNAERVLRNDLLSFIY